MKQQEIVPIDYAKHKSEMIEMFGNLLKDSKLRVFGVSKKAFQDIYVYVWFDLDDEQLETQIIMAQAKINAIYYESFGMSLNIFYHSKSEMQKEEPKEIDLFYIGGDRIARKIGFFSANLGIIGGAGSSLAQSPITTKPTFEELANMKELPILKGLSKVLSLHKEKIVSRRDKRKVNHKGGRNKAFRL